MMRRRVVWPSLVVVGGHSLLLLTPVHRSATPSLALVIRGGAGHDREYRETRREFGEFWWDGGRVGYVRTTGDGLGLGDRRAGGVGGGGGWRTRGELGTLLGAGQGKGFNNIGVLEGPNNLRVGKSFCNVRIVEERVWGSSRSHAELLRGEWTFLSDHVEEVSCLVAKHAVARH